MIKINGIVISNQSDFIKHFSIEPMLKCITQIAEDEDIFDNNESCHIQDLLNCIISGQTASILESKLVVGEEEPLVLSWSQINLPDKQLSSEEAKFILINELGQHKYTITEDGQKGTLVNMSEIRGLNCIQEAGSIIKLKRVTSETKGELWVKTIWNKSKEGIISITDGITPFEISPGEVALLLMCGDSYVTAIDTVSASMDHANKIIVLNDTQMAIENSKTGKQYIYPFGEVSSVDADEEGGFVAVVNGTLMSYSKIISPEDIEDLEIEASKKVVLVSTLGRQILALTSDGQTYSNINGKLNGLNDIVLIGRISNQSLYAKTVVEL